MQTNVTWDEAKGEWVDPTAKEIYPHRPVWTPDEGALQCKTCMCDFSMWVRRHHCRACGGVFCHKCSSYSIELPPELEYVGKQRVCLNCYTRIVEKNKQTDAPGTDDSSEEILTAQNFIRELPELTFNKAVGAIGARKSREKCYVMMDMKVEDKKGMVLLTVVTWRFSTLNAELGARFFQRMMTLIEHPNILPIKKCKFIGESAKAVIVRGYRSKGSLKDLLYRATPSKPRDRKYVAGYARALSLKEVAYYGRQVLEGMAYLESFQYPFPHLHTGNVLISGDKKTAAISEVENTMLGLRPQLRLTSTATPEAECFARLLYEISTGDELVLGTTPLDAAPKPVFEVLKCVLEPAPGDTPPSISDLLKFSFFASVAYECPKVAPLKLKAKARAMLDDVVQALPARIQATEEQDDEEILSPTISPRAPNRRGSAPSVKRSAVSPRSRKLGKAKTTSQLTSSGNTPTPASPSSAAKRTASPSQKRAASPAPSAAPVAAPSSGGPPPPPPAGGPPPPPAPPPAPAAVAKAMPKPQSGRGDLLASIRQGKSLKKVDPAEIEKRPPPPASSGGGGGGGPISIADALRLKFASVNKG